ncbi:MAG: prepilin-type N-terminal cleavage/methylation domain-containing protein [Oscillospiraceae bacterium]|nr:prepilin-type N-terminal cleavage/methylation domain-containing protein [Oscillospiraceae bacterium]
MKKTFKGFTLIECIVALAVLGVASLTLAQIYSSVALKNRENHIVNTSLSNQMAYVEKYTDSASTTLNFGGSTSGTPPHKDSSSTNNYYVQIKSSYTGTSTYFTYSQNTYSYGVDVHVLKSRDSDDNVYDDAADNKQNLRYKYLTAY